MTAEQKAAAAANPFPGLRPFETDEYRLFFGREGQSDALVERLGRSRFLAVVGTSGSGKSSLVRAGLLPALRGGMMAGAGAGWRVAVLRPGHDPVGNLARSLAEAGVLAESAAVLSRAEAEAVIEATLRRGSLGLVEAAARARLGEREKLLVVVDQFEELFRFRAARAAAGAADDDAAAFVKLLLEAAAQRDLPVYVVLTMRSDFLGDCAQFWGLPEAINDGQYLIPRMTRDERRFAIVGPVRVARARMSEPLINRLLNDVGDNPDQLPILQHALMRTWDYWAGHRRDSEPLGLEHYEAVGTMSDALSRHADEAWDELPDERGRRIAEALFKALTERGTDNREIRRPTRLAEICEIADATTEEVAAVVEVFRREGRSFLMPPPPAPLTPSTVIDISHESLIRNWERLKKWVAEEAQSARAYRRVAESATLHAAGQESLASGAGLQVALDWRDKARPNAAWAARYHPAFAEAMAFLDESKAAHEADISERERQREEQLARDRRELEQAQRFAAEQQRAAQRMRRLMFVLALVSLVALGAAGGAASAYKVAERAKGDALREKETAEGERNKARAAEETARASEKAARAAELNARAAEETALAAEKAARAAKQEAVNALALAEAQKARALQLARREAAAKAGMQIALNKAVAIRRANQSFRDALADFDRAESAKEVDEAYSEIEKSVDRFREKGVEDFGGAAAAYIKLGVADKQIKGEGEASRKVELWDKAVKNYRLHGSHIDAGETLEGIGDELLAEASLKSRKAGAAGGAGGQPEPLAADEDPDNLESKAEKLESKALAIPEEDRAKIAGRYEAAFGQYQQEHRKKASALRPDELPETLLHKMILVLTKGAVFYDSLGPRADRDKAAKSYEQLLNLLELERGRFKFARRFVTARLLRINYESNQVDEVNARVDKLREAERRRGGAEAEEDARRRGKGGAEVEAARSRGAGEAEAEALRAVAIVLGDHPQAPGYAEEARQLFRKHNPRREASVYYNMGNAIKKLSERRKQPGQPPPGDAYRLALDYYRRALKYYEPEPVKASAFHSIPASSVWERMAELHEVAGHPGEAAAAYEEAIKLTEAIYKSTKPGGDLIQLHRKLAKAREDAGQTAEALEAYRDYLDILNKADAEKCESARVWRIVRASRASAPPR